MLKLRGHNLLCLQDFQGEGYDRIFVANMERIHKTLLRDPDTDIVVVVEPDDICKACPHLGREGCTSGGAGSEERIKSKDLKTLNILGLSPGGTYKWKYILDRIRNKISNPLIESLCKDCMWLSKGFCRIFGDDNT